MEQETRDHIETAERNRDFARSLLSSPVAQLLSAPPNEWATVIAFYAAVHYVNAYIWERYRIEPRNHAERGQYVQQDPVLRRCERAYRQLRDAGYRSRYVRLCMVPRSEVEGLVNVELAHVEATVMGAI